MSGWGCLRGPPTPNRRSCKSREGSVAADNIIGDRMPGIATMSTIARTARADRHVGRAITTLQNLGP